ncbi:unnamed protein product [Linum tenue]|uniref:Uncharacterized protein n=1 Tax=Linum tenue TaxID=586396 RepID=A0AAV0LML1_9ROSI|nr:unnamed protein product [Linum tenue]
MLRLSVSWDRRKQSGQVDFNAGFTAPPAHLAILYIASAAAGLAAALLAGRRLLWALELTILSDVGNMFTLSVLLPTLTKKVKESKLSVTSTPEKYNVSLVAPDVAWQYIALLSAMTLGAAWNGAIVDGSHSSLALVYYIASLRSFVAMVRLGLPQSVADSKSSKVVASLVGLHVTQIIGETLLGTGAVGHDQEEIGGLNESSTDGEDRRSKHDEYMKVDDYDDMQETDGLISSLTDDEMRGTRVVGDQEETNEKEVDDRDHANNGTGSDHGSTVDDGGAQLDGWDWEHVMIDGCK